MSGEPTKPKPPSEVSASQKAASGKPLPEVQEVLTAMPATNVGKPEIDEWFLNSDKVLWRWPYAQETLVLELD